MNLCKLVFYCTDILCQVKRMVASRSARYSAAGGPCSAPRGAHTPPGGQEDLLQETQNSQTCHSIEESLSGDTIDV